MVETITPVVYGRRTGYVIAVVLHTVAATVTSAALGAALGLVGMLLGAPWGTAGLVGVAVVAILYAVREAFRLPIPLPNLRRQVPEWWRTFYSPPVAATLYGAGLGVAFVTFLSYGTFVAVAAGAVASGDPLVGALIAAPFGLARGLSVALVGARRAEPGPAVASVTRVGESSFPRAVNTTALVGIAIAMLATVAG